MPGNIHACFVVRGLSYTRRIHLQTLFSLILSPTIVHMCIVRNIYRAGYVASKKKLKQCADASLAVMLPASITDNLTGFCSYISPPDGRDGGLGGGALIRIMEPKK